jgi:hypothetical protein
LLKVTVLSHKTGEYVTVSHQFLDGLKCQR